MPKSPDACRSKLFSIDSDALMVDLSSKVACRVAAISRTQYLRASIVCVALLVPWGKAALGESIENAPAVSPASENELQQPIDILPAPASIAPHSKTGGALAGPVSRSLRKPVGNATRVPKLNATEHHRMRPQNRVRQLNFQTTGEPSATTAPKAPDAPDNKKKDPCASIVDRPFHEYGISTAMSGNQFPDDHATECWAPINDGAGPFVGARSWGATTFAWNATCLCHRPLYFEEINLERYGYGCCESLQPAASAAHFFATIPALPYCMATDCPCDCIYTLGHYRPGSCNPWQCHWPRFTTRAALAEGGVWTGLVFLIP
jgi:hypothetical protein